MLQRHLRLRHRLRPRRLLASGPGSHLAQPAPTHPRPISTSAPPLHHSRPRFCHHPAPTLAPAPVITLPRHSPCPCPCTPPAPTKDSRLHSPSSSAGTHRNPPLASRCTLRVPPPAIAIACSSIAHQHRSTSIARTASTYQPHVRSAISHSVANTAHYTALVLQSCEKNCTGHGTCANGLCSCFHGFSGQACDQVSGSCPKNCTGHGACDEQSGTCVCDPVRCLITSSFTPTCTTSRMHIGMLPCVVTGISS